MGPVTLIHKKLQVLLFCVSHVHSIPLSLSIYKCWMGPRRTGRKRLHFSSGLCHVAEASSCPQFGDLVVTCFYYKYLFVFFRKLLSHTLAHIILKTLWRIIILIFLRKNWDPETSYDLFRAMHSINWTESGPKSTSAACQCSTTVDYTTPPSRGDMGWEHSFLCLIYILAVAKNVCSSCPALTYSKQRQLAW